MKLFAAVDLGASSGRVMLGEVGEGTLKLTEAYRFPNRPVLVNGTLYWDILGLYRGVLDGLRAAAAVHGRLDGVGVDSWAVDYGLLGEHGSLLGNPVHYRDQRTARGVERVLAKTTAEQLYAATGTQFQPFNTLFQLAADPDLGRAAQAVLVPDLITYWLTGRLGTERTNASTTGLLDPRTGDWSAAALSAGDLSAGLFPHLRDPGEPAGRLLPAVLDEIGLHHDVPVFTVGSHDTASAVAAVPARDEHFAYVSSGTWSLAGLELPEPVLTAEAGQANFTNERGVDGRIRFLRNVMGLWLLQECQRRWGDTDLPSLLSAAEHFPGLRSVVDATDGRFLAPADMPSEIAAACRETGQPEPRTRAEITRCVLDSLALATRDAVSDALRLSGRHADVVHVVGGGARNELLCRLTADACGLPVVAGPVEAAALGNILVQARAAGALSGDPRELIRSTQPLRRHEPHGDAGPWTAAARRCRL
ncbi:rhamnulokinase [Amycolatopsis sp. H20-H5]|uniref:rhamnulokinase n=1 Tax=Amycolatopsis sp. H20-H5 TaxID=3046309 RepID=UPI002DB55757|nr:rhamnulokinase family protein [Amycolatopsis sp. H20-H5]MEC3978681.1 rhamnulokinase family protein [Amycolatopsis sp. H20-H5]